MMATRQEDQRRVQLNGVLDSSISRGRPYRVYVVGNELYFVRTGGSRVLRDAIGVQFGLIGGLITAFLKAGSEEKRKELIEESDQKNPEQLLGADKHNFNLEVSEFGESILHPPGFGAPIGGWQFVLRDGRKMFVQFEGSEDMSKALDVLPGMFGSNLTVNVAWDKDRQRYVKK